MEIAFEVFLNVCATNDRINVMTLDLFGGSHTSGIIFERRNTVLTINADVPALFLHSS